MSPVTAPIEDAMYIDAVAEVTWTQIVSASGLPENELRELVRYGALVPRDPEASTWTFSRERSSASSARTAPASRRRSTSCAR